MSSSLFTGILMCILNTSLLQNLIPIFLFRLVNFVQLHVFLFASFAIIIFVFFFDLVLPPAYTSILGLVGGGNNFPVKLHKALAPGHSDMIWWSDSGDYITSQSSTRKRLVRLFGKIYKIQVFLQDFCLSVGSNSMAT